jgi:hypothetical protein
MRSTYRALKLALLVGVCGGVPSGEHGDLFLGDVVISDSVVQYDFGRQCPDKFVRKGTAEDNLSRANKDMRSLLAMFKTGPGVESLEERTASVLQQLQAKAAQKHRLSKDKYKYPGIVQDKLFESDYRYKHRTPAACICRECTKDIDPVCDDALGLSYSDLGCEEEHLVRKSDVRLENRRQSKLKNNVAAQQPYIYILGLLHREIRW